MGEYYTVFQSLGGPLKGSILFLKISKYTILGGVRSSKAAMGGGWGAQRPALCGNEPKSTSYERWKIPKRGNSVAEERRVADLLQIETIPLRENSTTEKKMFGLFRIVSVFRIYIGTFETNRTVSKFRRTP